MCIAADEEEQWKREGGGVLIARSHASWKVLEGIYNRPDMVS